MEIGKKVSSVVEDTKDIYELEIHEEIKVSDDLFVLRVPGGWIYSYWNELEDYTSSGIFVPFVPKTHVIDNIIKIK